MDLLLSQTAEDEVVGMHCMHGINRSGYMVIYYLVKKFGMQLQEAIDLFEFHRQERIFKDLLMDDLK